MAQTIDEQATTILKEVGEEMGVRIGYLAEKRETEEYLDEGCQAELTVLQDTFASIQNRLTVPMNHVLTAARQLGESAGQEEYQASL